MLQLSIGQIAAASAPQHEEPDEEEEEETTWIEIELVDENDDPLLFKYPGAFINSGTRGFGQYVYYDMSFDDSLVSDPDVITLGDLNHSLSLRS